MKKTYLGLVLFITGICAAGCLPNATPEETNQMCENLIKLRGEIDRSTEAELKKKVEAQFAKEEKRLRDWMAKDLKSWDDEMAQKLEAAKDDAEKEKIEKDYAHKKDVTSQQHLPGIKELGPKKAEAIKEASEKAKENAAMWKKAITDCLDQAKKEGVSQKSAQCRIKAQSTDEYWNQCR